MTMPVSMKSSTKSSTKSSVNSIASVNIESLSVDAQPSRQGSGVFIVDCFLQAPASFLQPLASSLWLPVSGFSYCDFFDRLETVGVNALMTLSLAEILKMLGAQRAARKVDAAN